MNEFLLTVYQLCLLRYLVLVTAATGKMGTANTINAMLKKKLESSQHVAEVHNNPTNATDSDKLSNSSPKSDSNRGRSSPSRSRGSNRHSAASSEEGFVYNQKTETLLVNPCDLFVLLQKIQQGLKSGLFSQYEVKCYDEFRLVFQFEDF